MNGCVVRCVGMPYVQLGNWFFSVAMKICDFARSEFTTFLNNNYYYSVHRRDVPDPKERILADRKALRNLAILKGRVLLVLGKILRAHMLP